MCFVFSIFLGFHKAGLAGTKSRCGRPEDRDFQGIIVFVMFLIELIMLFYLMDGKVTGDTW